MSRSKALSDTSRVTLELKDHVVMLEIDGVPGWHLPVAVDVGWNDVSFRWELIADRPLDLRGYRIWFGEQWFSFEAGPTHIAQGYSCQIDATLKCT